MPELCIVVPCYNEAARLDSRAYLRCLEDQPEIRFCFVNDGSSDRTGEVLKAMQGLQPNRIQVLELPRNSGKGEAVRQGCLHAGRQHRYDWLGYWDADLATPLGQIDLLLRRQQEAGEQVVFVLASRVRRLGSDVRRSQLRHFVGRVMGTFASLVLDLPVYDSQCGAKLVAPAALDIAFEEPFLSPWLFDVEILARLRNHYGAEGVLERVLEVPVLSWHEKGDSRLRWKDFVRMPFELARLSRRYNSAARRLPRGKLAGHRSGAS